MHIQLKLPFAFGKTLKRLQLKELALSQQREQVSYESYTEIRKRKHLMAKLVNKNMYICFNVCVNKCCSNWL